MNAPAANERVRVDYRQVWIIPTATFFEEFPEEWADAQRKGLSEREFVDQSIKVMGEDLRDLAEREEEEWDWMTL